VTHPEAEPGEAQVPSSLLPHGAVQRGLLHRGELLLCAGRVVDLEWSVPCVLLPGTWSVPQDCGRVTCC